MINHFVLTGTINNLYCENGKYFIKVDVDGTIIECELWKGIYDMLFEKPFDTIIGIKGHIKVEGDLQNLMAERVSIITQNT